MSAELKREIRVSPVAPRVSITTSVCVARSNLTQSTSVSTCSVCVCDPPSTAIDLADAAVSSVSNASLAWTGVAFTLSRYRWIFSSRPNSPTCT